ncbi:hypothetical protein DL89DRAFT_289842 [Linderina pennispora]|uniref:Uncharacterized protein n=1 Tax=Linderina pennispora TaxID=61395 RepID=A0A1Y1WLQ9_9FUNG|nr:uncharacterized protein DL89DRAFT_289842 [Linderina pennispora]ORX74238.1 hypothetical protein DL89DRAFT_289842 [Linderina pennispora]
MSSQYTSSSDTQASARLYELETTVSQIRDASAKTQLDHTRLEKRHNLALAELQDLQKSHSRLEHQYFETERQLQAASAQLDKAQRQNNTLASQLEAKTRELELAEQLATAKKKVTMQRRQTVNLGAPAREEHDGETRRLALKAREAEARAVRMEGAAEQVRREAQLVAADLVQSQRKCDKLEQTIKQLNELNEGLREDNESYQMLLQMGTIKGGFKLSSGRASFDSRKYSPDEAPTRSPSSMPSPASQHPGGLDLAAELDQALSVSGSSRTAELEEQLQSTIAAIWPDENKALSLYLARDYDSSAASTPTAGSPLQRSSTVRSPVVQQKRQHGRTRSTFSPLLRETPPVPDMSTFPVRGSGDGITSVFVPPTSPSAQSAAQFSPLPVKNPERFAGRARSQTHSAGMAPMAPPVPTPRPNAGNAQAGGTWWKRMSVRIGGGWNMQDGPDQSAAEHS